MTAQPLGQPGRAGWLQYTGGVSPAERRANQASGLPSGITDLGYQQLAATLAARGQRTAARLGLPHQAAPFFPGKSTTSTNPRSAPYYDVEEGDDPEVVMPWPPEGIDTHPISELHEGQGDIMYWAGAGRMTEDISDRELGTIISRVESFLPGFIQQLQKHEADVAGGEADGWSPEELASKAQEIEQGWAFVDEAQSMVADLQAYLDKHTSGAGKQAAIGFTIQSPAQAAQLGFVAIAGAPGMLRRVAASSARPGHRRTASVQRTAAIARVGHAIWEMRGRQDGAFDIVRLHDERDPDFRTASTGAFGARSAARVMVANPVGSGPEDLARAFHEAFEALDRAKTNFFQGRPPQGEDPSLASLEAAMLEAYARAEAAGVLGGPNAGGAGGRMGGRYDDPDRGSVILTDGKGRPYDRPGPAPAPDAPEDEHAAWRRSVYDHNDQVANDANKAFSDEFRKKVKKGDRVKVAHGGAIRPGVVESVSADGRTAQVLVGGKRVASTVDALEVVGGSAPGVAAPRPFV